MPTRGDWALPTYLLLASLANVAFLRRAVRDARERASAHALALLALALAELCWVLPCFAQCALTFYDNGARWWVPARAGVGCTVMGFYSVFASVAGQLLTAQIAALSLLAASARGERLAAAPRDARRCARRSALLLAASLGVAAVPLARDGGFASSGDGFCYIDWSDPAQVAPMMAVTAPCMAVVVASYYRLARDDADGRGRVLWPIALFVYVSAWALWVPAAGLGLASSRPYPDMFPSGYMLAGAVLGHAQAWINPLLYGVYWRARFVADDKRQRVEEGITLDLTPVTTSA